MPSKVGRRPAKIQGPGGVSKFKTYDESSDSKIISNIA